MKKKILALISIVLVFSFLFIFAGCDGTNAEDETTTTTTIKVKTPLPTDITTSIDEESNTVTDTTYSPEALAANTVTIFDYFNLHINEVKGQKAAVNMSQGKSISKVTDAEGNSLPLSENEYIAAAISSLDSYMLHTDGADLAYGEDLAAFLPVKGQSYVSALTLEDIESATCVDNELQRYITLTLKSPSLPATIEKAYDMGNVDDVLTEFKKAEKYLTVGTPTLTYNDCQIILTTNVETDEVIAIEYIKNIDVATEVTGTGTLESVGTVPVNFRYQNTVKYSLDRTVPETTVAE